MDLFQNLESHHQTPIAEKYQIREEQDAQKEPRDIGAAEVRVVLPRDIDEAWVQRAGTHD